MQTAVETGFLQSACGKLVEQAAVIRRHLSTCSRCVWTIGCWMWSFCPLLYKYKYKNTLPSRHKQYNFNLTTYPQYLVKLIIAQNGRTLTAVHSVESIVRKFCRSRSVFRSFLSLIICPIAIAYTLYSAL